MTSHRPRSRTVLAAWLALAAWLTMTAIAAADSDRGASGLVFVDVATAAGLDFVHGDLPPSSLGQFMGGGVAAGDYDGDGWVDLYAVSGTAGANRLLRNQGDGTFVDVAASAGVDLTGTSGSGPTFVDLDGDGLLDLVVGNLESGRPWLFRNLGDGTFEDRTATSGLPAFGRVFSIAAGDVDLDGDLDLFFSQWNAQPADPLWRNEGDFQFSSATVAVLGEGNASLLRTFTPNFVHLDDDGWPDLLVASDFENSQTFLSRGDGTLERTTDPSVIVDQNGMGAAVGDYDNDGDLDWFVSSIYNASDPFYQLGNRLYQNRGDGSFDDVTEVAGVKHGHWGWGACFADFDNDGRLDLFHVNGWRDPPYSTDPSRLFLQANDGTFVEQAADLGLDDRGQGRGVACFDFDRDGDLDIYVANNSGPPALYRNDGGNLLGHRLEISLRMDDGNRRAIGARVVIHHAGSMQTRELRAGSNFASQSPDTASFGLGAATAVPRLTVEWPGGGESTASGVAAGDQKRITNGLIFSAGFEHGSLEGWDRVEATGVAAGRR